MKRGTIRLPRAQTYIVPRSSALRPSLSGNWDVSLENRQVLGRSFPPLPFRGIVVATRDCHLIYPHRGGRDGGSRHAAARPPAAIRCAAPECGAGGV
jgi:hypothetical protein